MTTTGETSFVGVHPSRWATFVACVTIGVAMLSITGWALDAVALKSLRPGWPTMKVNTATGLILCSVALLALVRCAPGRPLRLLAPACAGLTFLLGAAIVCEHLFNFDLGIHGLLVPAGETVPDRVIAGRMSPATAYCLALTGAGILLAWRWIVVLHPLVGALGFSIALFGGFTLAGYAVDGFVDRRVLNYTGMAAHTATCFVLLGSGLAALVPPGEARGWWLDRATTLGFVAGVTLMLVAVTAAFHFTSQLQSSATWVGHRHKALTEVRELMGGLAAISGKERAFLLTGEEELLRVWTDAKAAVRASFRDLRNLTSDNAVQTERLDRLEPLISERIELAERSIAAWRTSESGRAMAALDGFHLDKRLAARLLEIEREELNLLSGDETRAKEVSTTAFLLLPVWVFLGVTMLLGGLFFLNHGVGRRMAAEHDVREANASLERRVAERTAELELANKELDSFCYSVSHDLRTPLRAISGFTRVISQNCGEAFAEKDRDYMSRVLAATDRMGELIDDLLKLSRVSREELHPQEVDLSGIARGILDDLRQASPDRTVEATVRDGMVARGDARLLRAMLDNLLGNAWKFTSKTPVARIAFDEVRGEGGARVFRVRDNGAGFDMRYADKLFGPFQRLHRQGEFPGTGIGLATVQRIVHRHGGRVWADAAPNAGATFSFSL